jgi:hypothetical protein
LTTIELEKTYQEESDRFREAWSNGRVAAEQAHGSVNNMVRLLKRDNEKWAIRKVLSKIASDHEDLEGFSLQNLYKYLDEENSKLLQNKHVSSRKPKVGKKETEQKDKEPEEPSEIELAEIKIKQQAEEIERLKEIPRENLIQTANQLIENKELVEVPKDESSVFEYLKKQVDGVHSFYYDAYGIDLFKNRELAQLKNSGVKTFKRLYFEV